MTPVRRRIARALTVLATLALAACAVPGQGDPAGAATLGDRVVTNAQVRTPMRSRSSATPLTGPGLPLTFLLLGPDYIARRGELGFILKDSDVTTVAQGWMTFDHKEGTATPGTSTWSARRSRSTSCSPRTLASPRCRTSPRQRSSPPS